MDLDRNGKGVSEAATLNSLEIDTIGEVLNISMGSAATAISTMLDQRVIISTPNVEIHGFSSLDYAAMEPAMLVKINYIKGLYGSNVMIFRQRDMQVILALLMGNDVDPDEEFIFDELSISAACEVMNQMMGASATALSDFLGRAINISTPEAVTVESRNNYQEAVGVSEGESIVSVSFRLTIEGVMDSNFVSIMTIDLAKDLISELMGEQEKALEELSRPAKEPEPAPAARQTPHQQPAPEAYPQQFHQGQQPPAAPPQGHRPPMQTPPEVPPQAYADPGLWQQPYDAQPPYPPYGYQAQPYGYQMPAYGYAPPEDPGMAAGYGQPSIIRQQPAVNIQSPQFPQFAPQQTKSPETGTNMDLLMQVSLDVSVEIGKARRKIKEIVDFGQGSVIELNKQAGAPVDIVVNGCLLARGDVVVIDDNFGVRITEIVGAKELMESLKEDNGL